jgi:hypothetical protein
VGGRGSGSFPDDGSTHRGGRQKKAAVAVVGSGTPCRPDGMSEEIVPYWNRLEERLSGVAFEQDSDAMAELATLSWRQQKFHEALQATPLDEELNRLSLAVGRALSALWTQFGQTPRSRQLLLVPREEQEKDEFERMMEDG